MPLPVPAAPAPSASSLPGLKIVGSVPAEGAEILTDAALTFVADLHARFAGRRAELLAARVERRAARRSGAGFGFDPATADLRAAPWTVAAPAPALTRRHVEITAPVERKMIISALNSGADVFMADFEDSSSPTWENQLLGQVHLRDAVRGTIRFTDAARGKEYALADRIATLMVRPRGWHLPERHIEVDGAPACAALVDFGLFMAHNARALAERGQGPFFYLPKLEHGTEAQLWDDVFRRAQELLGLPVGTIRATVLLETLPAAFQMDEILFALRDHSAGLNCGRWDYIFSVIKEQAHDPGFLLPDRSAVGMTQPLMAAYTEHVVRTCHRRGAHAMGGMAAQIPIKDDAARNDAALGRVRADKEREVRGGHDGTWVAHPGLVPLAREVFGAALSGDHQIGRQVAPREEIELAAALVRCPQGPRTDEGLRQNVNVALLYLRAWLAGSGCVPIHDLMEDAATAEISRSQLWQWVRHGATTDDGRPIDGPRFEAVLAEELAAIEAVDGAYPTLERAASLLRDLVLADELADFLTLPAYALLP